MQSQSTPETGPRNLDSAPVLLAPRLTFSALSVVTLVAGAFASGANLGSPDALLALLLALVLTQIAWTTFWQALAETAWREPLREWRSWKVGAPLRPLPYTQPGSASEKMAATLGRLNDWANQRLWPNYGAALAGLLGAIVVGLVLSLVLGAQATGLTLAALLLAQIGLLLCRADGRPAPLLGGLMWVSLPMMLGAALFHGLEWDLTVAALGLGLAYAGTQAGPKARWYWLVGSGVVLALLVLTRRPLGAFAIALLALPQVLLAPARHIKIWLMAMILAAAIAIS